MTRKHFNTIANTIAIQYDAATTDEEAEVIRRMAQALARDFARFNCNFSPDRFMREACSDA